MQTLYFAGTILIILILVFSIIVRFVHRRTVSKIIITLLAVSVLYVFLWIIFSLNATNQAVPLSTDICFDDWCATVTSYEKVKKIGRQVPSGQFIILTIKMTNKARGIAQKPSEPKVHIIDNNRHSWSTSMIGQNALDSMQGHLLPLDERLELHQSLETKLVFDVPKNSTNLTALIEEGPFVTKLLLKSDNKVFKIQ